MRKFTYKATDKTGKLITGEIEAPDESIAIIKLQEQNLLPISVKKFRGKKHVSFDIKIPSPFGGIKEKDIMEFTQQLSTLLNAGLPLDRSLKILKELTEKKKLIPIVSDIHKNVHSGITLSESLSKYPKAFSSLYTSMVKAGESGGILEVIIDRLYYFLENAQFLRDSVISAMVYPIILLSIGGGAIFILLTYVVPKFAQIFLDMGQDIPMSTQLLLNVSDFLVNYYLLLAVGFFSIFILFRVLLTTTIVKEKWDGIKLKTPLIGDLIRKIEVSRFSRTFGTLINSGVSILKAVDIVKDTLTNESIKKSMQELTKKLKRGGGIAGPLKQSNVFPAMAVHMVAIGEETGKLEEMLFSVADAYDKEVQTSIKRVISLIEPIMILIMGIAVGFVVISMLLAVFSVNDIPL